MAYYCNECSEWINSSDNKMSYHNGRYVEHRWCKYDRTYRAADQNVYGCRGFVYVKRTIITKVCEILGIDNKQFFDAFDDVKEEYIVPTEFGKLVDYNEIGTSIAEGLDNHPKKDNMAKNILETFIIPALAHVKLKEYDKAVELYERMVKTLALVFEATKEQVEERKLYDNLVSVR